MLNDFLSNYPDIERIELVVTDPGGVVRGKWAPVNTLKKAFGDGVNFPLSLHGLDVWGNEVDATGLHISSGDLDGFFKAVPETLSAVPWAGDGKQIKSAQLILETFNADGTPFSGCSRQVLNSVKRRCAEQGINPVVAFELEFHLLTPDAVTEGRAPEIAQLRGIEDAQYMYDLDALASSSELFEDIRTAAQLAAIPLDTIVKEAAPAQYEINLNHRDDIVRAADDVVLLKRIIRECARKHGYVATFMAKPFAQQPGNGMHVHCSLLDGQGGNIFKGSEGEAKLESAVAGLLRHMHASTLVFVNTINGFRRMAAGSYAPTRTNWGENNRSVAIRLPAAPEDARRIEHRVAGADANPYLVAAMILGAMLDGMKHGLSAQPKLEGNAYDENTANRGDRLPETPLAALAAYQQSDFPEQVLGGQLADIVSAIKQSEQASFSSQIHPLEWQSYI